MRTVCEHYEGRDDLPRWPAEGFGCKTWRTGSFVDGMPTRSRTCGVISDRHAVGRRALTRIRSTVLAQRNGRQRSL